MPGIAVKVNIDAAPLKRRIERLLENMTEGAVGQALKACGVVALRSIEKNFREGGRPQKWAELKPTTVKRKKKTGHTKTLIDSGTLKNSITAEVSGNVLTVGTVVPHARIHQLGGDIQRAKKIGMSIIRIPARPYLVVQDEDKEIFKKILRDMVLKR